jgi:hypothetical protein
MREVGSVNNLKIFFTKIQSQKFPLAKWVSKKNFYKKSDYKKSTYGALQRF